MGFKNISISEEVYARLKKRKDAHESFSDEISRLLRQEKVSDLGRIITDEEAREWQAGVQKVRESVKVRSWSS
ncbi:antitoxin VapB family protein [Candidatus Micrarchaeota archaeon]|nr:antitoxin VapB family protein [Candidatus Micrarchaeota archaeon]